MREKWIGWRGGRGRVRIPGGREFPGILRDFFSFTTLEVALSLVKPRRHYGRTDGNR